MAKTSIRRIFQQNKALKEQMPLVSFIKGKERTLFYEEIEILIDAAQQAIHTTKSQETKTRLQNIVEMWEAFLEHPETNNLPVISKTPKTSRALIGVEVEDSSGSDFLHDFISHVTRLISHLWSPNKIDPDAPVPFLYNPELRAISDEFYGVTGAKGEKK